MAGPEPSRSAVVTGASSGIGAATARALAAAGYRVALLARTAAKLDALRADIAAAGGVATAYPVDVTDAEAVAAVAERILAEHGAPDVLFNNAGVGRWRALTETSPAEARDMMAAPYLAAFYVDRALLPAMLARGRGHVLHITSPAGFFPVAGAAAYSAARWAMRGLHETLWAELYGTGVAATLVCPAKVESDYFRNNPGSEERIPKAGLWMGSMTPEQVARRIVRSLRRRPKYLFMPFRVKLFLWTHRLWPALVEWISVRTGWRRAVFETRPGAALADIEPGQD